MSVVSCPFYLCDAQSRREKNKKKTICLLPYFPPFCQHKSAKFGIKERYVQAGKGWERKDMRKKKRGRMKRIH